MNVFNINDLVANGFEIGGRTVTGVDLTDVTIPIAVEEVCRDRATLIANGWQVRSFAYPFSSFDTNTQNIVKDCGYNSAQHPDTIKSSTTLPYLLGQYNVQSYNTLSDIQSYIGSNSYSIVNFQTIDVDANGNPTGVFKEFIDWLKTQSSSLSIINVGNVIGGPLKKVPPYFQNTPATPTPDRNAFIKIMIGSGSFAVIITVIIYVAINTKCTKLKKQRATKK